MIETSIKVSPDQVFSDLAGKITANDGDTVAHLRGYHGKNWWQPVHSRRPVYRDGWLVFDAVDDRLIEGVEMTDLIPRDAAIRAVNLVIWKSPIKAQISTIDASNDTAEALRAIPTIDPAAIREAALWDLLEEIDAQIDLAEEISPEFADKVQLALWAGQTKGAAE